MRIGRTFLDCNAGRQHVSMQCKRETDCRVASLLAMTGILYTAFSFAKWHFLSTGDPTVGLTAASVQKLPLDKRKYAPKISSLPPLCKGRWFGASRTGRIVRINAQIRADFRRIRNIHNAYNNPSVSLRLTAPFTQGSQESDFYSALSFAYWQ